MKEAGLLAGAINPPFFQIAGWLNKLNMVSENWKNLDQVLFKNEVTMEWYCNMSWDLNLPIDLVCNLCKYIIGLFVVSSHGMQLDCIYGTGISLEEKKPWYRMTDGLKGKNLTKCASMWNVDNAFGDKTIKMVSFL